MEYGPSENPSKPQKSASEWLQNHRRFEALASGAAQDQSTLMEYTAGEIIHSPSRPFTQCALILNGRASLVLLHSDGQQSIVANLESGECFGDRITAGSSNENVIIRAEKDLTLLTLPAEQMDSLINRSSSLASEIGEAIEVRRQAVIAAKRMHHASPK